VAAFRFFALVLQYMLLRRTGKADKLGSFHPKLTTGQLEDFEDLYAELRSGRDAQASVIRPIIYRLLYSSFTMQLDPHLTIGSAFEQSIVLSMLAPEDGHYRSANHLTSFFSWIQRTCFSTFFHTAWLNTPNEARHAIDDAEDSNYCDYSNDNDEQMDESDLDIEDMEDEEEIATQHLDNTEGLQYREVSPDDSGDTMMEIIDASMRASFDLVEQSAQQSDGLLR